MTDVRTRDEIDPSSRGRRGAHRAAPSRLAVLLPVAVVVAVVVLTALALVFFTGLGGRGAAGGDVSASAPATTPTTAPPTTAPTTPSAPTSAPSTSGPTSPGGDGSSTSPSGDQGSRAPGVDERGADDGAPPPPGGAGDGAQARGAPVVVLNATRTSGIAARTAEDLKGEGWTVSRTGDADGSVDATRVRYSDPALESAAQAVAASLGGAKVELDAGVEKGVVTVVAGPDRVGR